MALEDWLQDTLLQKTKAVYFCPQESNSFLPVDVIPYNLRDFFPISQEFGVKGIKFSTALVDIPQKYYFGFFTFVGWHSLDVKEGMDIHISS